MANQEHLDILKQGVEVWNKWREEHPLVKPDLSGADLNGANLAGANFSRTDLRHVQLNKAILRSASFTKANLSEASLVEADLSDADLIEANLRAADLRKADFTAAEVWNASLRETDLKGANLSGAELYGVEFWKANMSGANLSEAELSDANLSSANLNHADLNNANLYGANLSDADLSDAGLQNTGLSQALFVNTTLQRTDFSKAHASGTIFGNVNLQTALGLETIKHQAPSIIDFGTISRSQGNIPDVFLVGAGLFDSQINYVHTLVNKPNDYYSCFISYSSKDDAFAKRLYADLQREGVRCWFAPEDMDIGDKIRPRIEESVRKYDKLLLILSEHSIASTWVAYEVERALNKEPSGIPNVLFSVRVDDAVKYCNTAWANDIRSTRHIGDFSNWKDHDEYQKAFSRLLRALKSEPGKP